jgi:hypothetical protein
MEVVWRCSAKSLEYGIGLGERYRQVSAEIPSGQLQCGKDVSERVIGIHVRVIVNADGFVTIATALPSFFARNGRLAANVNFS